ncbi:MAG: glycosyltransferase family 4 protein [Candidatus Nanopelagicaceae bacterium]
MASILLVTNDFGPRAGGIESFVIGLLERVPAGEVIVYTSFQPEHESYDQKWFSDYQVRVVRDKSKVLLPTPRVIRNLQMVVRQNSITKVWFGAAAPLGVSSRWLRKVGVKQIVALTHGHEVWWSKIWPFSWAISEIGKQVDYVTYLGDFTKAALATQIKDSSKLIRVAPGIDTKHFSPSDSSDLREKHGLDNRPTVISVGRLVHRKGQDRLIEALPKVLEVIPDAALVLVGEGPYRKQLDALVKKYDLSEHVFFIGRINFAELPNYICMGDVFAMPSRSRLFGLEVEGLGIVYLEASSCGLPVIGGASGGAPDAVLDGDTGYVVDGNDLNAISTQIVKLLSDAKLRQKMGERGRAWAIDSWRWEIWSEEFNKALNI